MKCPVDNEMLVMTSRSGVEIDYCPKCRGVWLDRGELDKIIERSGEGSAPQAAAPRGRMVSHNHDDDHDEDHRHDDHRYGQHPGHKKKKSGLLGELFDF